MAVKDYSRTPSANTSLFYGGMAPSAVRPGLQQMQADIRQLYDGAPNNVSMYGTVADGSTDDSTAIGTAVTAMSTGAALAFPAATYAVASGVTVPGSKVLRLIGNGKAVLKLTGSATALAVSGDPAVTVGNRLVYNVEIDGNPSVTYGYRAGSIGLKWGDTTAPIVNGRTQDFYAHNCEVGLYEYSSQEALHDNVLLYRNRVGLWIQNDPTSGGATASYSGHLTSQYNLIGAVLDNQARFVLGTTGSFTSGSNQITNVANTTGLAAGQIISAPYAANGATISSVSGTTVTMSANSTLGSGSMASVPVLFKGSGVNGYGCEWEFGGQSTIQGNYNTGFAAWGIDALKIASTHFEANYQASATITGAIVSGSPTVTYSSSGGWPVYAGLQVSGAGIPANTVVNSFTATTLTLSNNATATNGSASLTLTNPATLTVGARSVPQIPVYLSACNALMENTLFGEPSVASGVAPMTIADGTVLTLRNCTLSGGYTAPAIKGDLTCAVIFEGRNYGLTGAIQGCPILRWPDAGVYGDQFAGFGNPARVRTFAFPNDYAPSGTGTARVPTLSVDGGATVSTANDSRIGPCRKAVFASTNVWPNNTVHFDLLNGTLNNGDTTVIAWLMCADTYTSVTIRTATVNGYAINVTLPVTPVPQLYVIVKKSSGTLTGEALYMTPTSTDAPTVYCADMMQRRIPAGGDLTQIDEIVARGLINDGTLDGALVATATWDPPSVAAAAQTTTTITVPGARLGMNVTPSFSLDLQAMQLTGYVSASDTVTVVLRNGTGAAIDLASGTLKVRVA